MPVIRGLLSMAVGLSVVLALRRFLDSKVHEARRRFEKQGMT